MFQEIYSESLKKNLPIYSQAKSRQHSSIQASAMELIQLPRPPETIPLKYCEPYKIKYKNNKRVCSIVLFKCTCPIPLTAEPISPNVLPTNPTVFPSSTNFVINLISSPHPSYTLHMTATERQSISP